MVFIRRLQSVLVQTRHRRVAVGSCGAPTRYGGGGRGRDHAAALSAIQVRISLSSHATPFGDICRRRGKRPFFSRRHLVVLDRPLVCFTSGSRRKRSGSEERVFMNASCFWGHLPPTRRFGAIHEVNCRAGKNSGANFPLNELITGIQLVSGGENTFYSVRFPA